MRILVTISPLMYREALALAIHRHSPDFEVLLCAPASPSWATESFAPHLHVRNDGDAELRSGAHYGMEVFYDGGGMHARFGFEGEEARETRNVGVDDMLGNMDRATRSMPKGPTG